jgi:crossover junction endodeoxyribonuclease RuvC
MKILGLDLSLTATGVVTIENGKPIFQTCIKSKLKNTFRLREITKEIKEYVIKFKPDYIALEGYSFSSKFGRIFSISELGGTVKLMLLNETYYEDKNLFIVPPTTIKKFITGKGNCDKNLMLLKVFKKYGIEFEDDNIADAFSVGMFVHDFIIWRNDDKSKHTKTEIECFKKYMEMLKNV